MKDKAAHARGWFLKADSDLADARRTVVSAGPFDTACFHAEQAAEKYLKGFLAFLEEPIPRTHDVEELQRVCLPFAVHSKFTEIDLTALSDYGVPSRYDLEFWPDRETAADALHLAEQVREIVLALVSKEALP